MGYLVAIVGDADMYHVDCARIIYGDALVDIVTDNVPQDAADELTDEQRETLEGLSGVLDNSKDLTDETGQPYSCGHCLGYLIEDERASDSPLARDILNLSVEYREEAATKVLSTLANAAREWDVRPEYLIDSTIPYYESLLSQYGADDVRPRAALTVIGLMQDWRAKWLTREIVTLSRDENGQLTDSDGNEWTEYDMRGYLDMFDDGESACESCGRRIESHAFYCVWDIEAYCPDCVTID